MPHPQDVAVPSLPRELNDMLSSELAQHVENYARAAVIADRAAGRASAEPEGFVLVPREPTQAMLAAAQGVFGHPLSKLSYRDMLAAAPTPTASIAPKAEGEAHQIITLCGSARFERLFKAWNEALTMAGHTVFGLTAYPSDKAGVKQWYSDEQKAALDAAHFRKIEASDAIFVINRNAYIGHSTMNEIEHARKHGKAIYFLESWGKGNGPIDSASPIDTTTRSGSRCPWSSRLLGPAGAVRNAIVKLTRGAESDAAPGAQAAAAAVKLPDVSELLVWAVEDDLLRMSKIMDADLQDALVAYSKRILALALSPRPSADADRASGGWVECPDCRGSEWRGWKRGVPCHTCKGSGFTPTTKD